MRVAIIGCGFVGSAVGRQLVASGHRVTGTTTTGSRTSSIRVLGIEPVVLDLANVNALHHAVRDRDVVVLCVAPRSRADGYRNTYLLGAQNLIEAVRGTPVTQIIYTGSTHVYGQDDGSWVDEDSPTNPPDENGRILVETERILLGSGSSGACDKQVMTTVLRLGGIYGGERDYLDFVHSQAGTRRTDGDMYINRIHVDDIVAAIQALLESPYHGVLNLCDDHPQTKRSFYDAVLAAADLPAISWTSRADEEGRGKRVRNTRIKETLGITLRHPRRIV